MKLKMEKKNGPAGSQRGISLPEVMVVLLVGAILVVLAIPHFMSSRQLRAFDEFQQKVVGAMNEARDQAALQKKPITFRYDDKSRRAVLFGGGFGPFGNAKNKAIDLSVQDLDAADIKFGQPEGVKVDRLADTSRTARAADGAVDFTFQPDGSMLDESKFPLSKAIFFYHDKYRTDSAFAVSVLGGSGRVKAWRYRPSAQTYLD
jgi:prepilin-type N-terminal cleavage/methylation domain-containing protein